ncbi:MAG: hypothetical protein IPF52_19140 [Saprospiraceae bacterium]|nr:hypothetical protein [Saprospiraceae bacterium]
MKNIILLLICIVSSIASFGQNNNVGIGTNTPDPSAILELSSTNQGLRLTRVPNTSAIANPVNGLLIFSESDQKLYYYNGTTWKELLNTELDPEINATTTDVIPRWNGSALVDGTIQDNATNVGIGTAPVANQKLTVNGKTTTTNLQMTTGANNGFVLQSDVSGNANWVNSNTLTVNNLYNTNGTLTSSRTITQGNNVLNFTNNGNQNTIFNLTSTGDFDIQKNGVSALFVKENSKVGINTSSPLAQLHVKDSSAVFTGLFPLPAMPGKPPVSGGGTRMMWYPDKAAFRVGTVINPKWDKDSVGIYSIAMGYDVIASAESATAIGRFSKASGFGSTAIGSEVIASGQRSFVAGSGNTASGSTSTSFGSSTIASGITSTSMGSSTVASGIISTAMGYTTTASGLYSTATGSESTASGSSSFTMGIMTNASGNGSMAAGELTKATGERSMAVGIGTNSRSFGSLALGRFNDSIATSTKTSWVATDPVFIIGNGTSDANRSNALTVYKNGTLQLQNLISTPANHSNKFYVLNNQPFYGDKVLSSQLEKITEGGTTGWRLLGRDPNNHGNIGEDAVDLSLSSIVSATNGATGAASIAMGQQTLASGNTSTALGINTTASGTYSTAMGASTNATGYASTAMGSATTASDFYAVAMGHLSSASGPASIAMGQSSMASGALTAAMGRNTIADSYASVSLGAYNATIPGSNPTTWVATDPVFAIGVGTSDMNRKNAVTILKNAKTGINTEAPLAGLHIKGVEATSDAHIRLENNANADYGNIFYDGNMKFRNFGADDQYQWFNSTNATTMSLNNNGELNLLGKLSAPNIQMTTGASNGRVLQSDASGNGSWVNVNTLSTNNLYNSNGSLTSARTITQGSNALTISNNGTQNTIINLSSTGDFDIQDNGTSALKVQDDGKVGINQSTPLAGLHIKGVEATFDAHIRLETAGAGTEYGNILYDGNMKFRNFGASDEYQWRNSANNIRMRLMDSGDFAVTGNANVGGLTLNAGSVSVTSNDQIVNVGNGSYLKLSSNSTTATDRTIILSDGLTAGQILMIESTSTGANVFEILDGAGSNTNTTGTITMTSGDMIQLLWNGSDWLQVSYANN